MRLSTTATHKALPRLSPVSVLFRPWKTLHLGECGSAREYRAAFAKNNFALTSNSTKMLSHVHGSMVAREIAVYRQSVGSLGFLNAVQLMEIQERINELGFMMCTPEIGPAARLQYTHQPIGERLVVPMKSILGRMFVIENDEGKMILASSEALVGGYWIPEDEFLFQKQP